MPPRIDDDTQVALLRGVNVGGHRRLPMAELRALCAGLGMTDVATYIQSGNVWFRGDASGLHDAILDRYGYDVPVVVRSVRRLRALLAARPFGDQTDDRLTHVVFFDRDVSEVEWDPSASPGDQLRPLGAEVVVHYGRGAGKSKLSAGWFERHSSARATARNWRTVRKLAGLDG